MGLIINGDTQFYTDGLEISKSSPDGLNMVYLDLQWVTPKGTGSMVNVRFDKFKDTAMTEPITTKIDGIPNDNQFRVDATPKIIERGGLLPLTLGDLHDLVKDQLQNDYVGFAGKISLYDPFAV